MDMAFEQAFYMTQAAGRRMSYHGLHHVLSLGVAYHSASSTGRLVRMVERGALRDPA